MKSTSLWGLLAVLVAALLTVAYWKYSQQREHQQTAAVQAPEVPVETPAKVEIKYPLAPPEEELPPATAADLPNPARNPLPALNASDEAMREALNRLFGSENLQVWILDHFAERFVLLVDSLPRRSLAIHRLPVQSAGGSFVIQGDEQNAFLSDKNYSRYAPFITLAQGVDAKKLVGVYRRHYPLFQEAYKDLGYPNGYFNDRFVEVIDHLLAAPEVEEPIRLERLAARYRFADSELESLSAGQKILVRMGGQNSVLLKEKLREIRRELIRAAAKG